MQEEFVTEIVMKEGYQFEISFDSEKLDKMMTDEPEPVGKGEYLNATRLLSAAVGNCLCASLAFCMRKVREEPKDLRATVRTTLTRNEKGRLRVKEVDVAIDIELEDASKFQRCKELFQQYCTISESVQNGFDVNVEVHANSQKSQ